MPNAFNMSTKAYEALERQKRNFTSKPAMLRPFQINLPCLSSFFVHLALGQEFAATS